MSTANGMNSLTIELPAGVLGSIARTPEEVAKAVRLAAAIERFREGRVSQGQGAEIAGLDRTQFL